MKLSQAIAELENNPHLEFSGVHKNQYIFDPLTLKVKHCSIVCINENVNSEIPIPAPREGYDWQQKKARHRRQP